MANRLHIPLEQRKDYAQPEEVERMLTWLENKRNGANVHTINKAKMYLESLTKPIWYLDETQGELGTMIREEMFISLAIGMRKAIADDSVDGLSKVMSAWF